MKKTQNSYWELLEIYQQDFIKINDIKNYLKILHNDEDDLLNQFINSAIETCENYCGVNLISKKIKYSLDNFSGDKVYLPITPVKEVNEIKVFSDKEDIIELDSIKLISKDGVILFEDISFYKKIDITYIAGLKNNKLIPKSFIQGILLHVAQMYDSGMYKAISEELQKLYQPYKKMRI